jgi:hypothetical protein
MRVIYDVLWILKIKFRNAKIDNNSPLLKRWHLYSAWFYHEILNEFSNDDEINSEID